MFYGLMRWIAGIALHWFYSDIRVIGREHVPTSGPLILAANHPNALVDALVAGWILPRKLSITAKATLVENPVLAILFRMLGIVPLRRVTDEQKKQLEGTLDPSRNRDAFKRVIDVLGKEGVVLIFPEGKSHNEPTLAPLRSGLARIALQARSSRTIRNIQIVPLGLKFQDKGKPNSVVIAEFGSPIVMNSWDGEAPEELTAEIERRLRVVSDPDPAQVFEPRSIDSRHSNVSRWLVRVAAGWGTFVHKIPIELARTLALRRGGDEDQPAMLTIVYGLGLLLLYYLVVGILAGMVGGFALSIVLILSFATGAYWAAFRERPRGY